MRTYEYKSILVKGKFKNQASVSGLDKVINAAAADGWELVSTAARANNYWNHGHTSGVLLTFRGPT
jgi:hypothetical protein